MLDAHVDERRQKATEIAGDLLEPIVDAFTQSGILRDIPLLGTAMKLAQLSRSVSDRIFLAKVEQFVQSVPPVHSAAAAEFARKLDEDPMLAERTGQALLLSIDALNDLAKAPILGLVFASFLRDEIAHSQFLRLSAAVNLAVVDDLWTLAEIEPGRLADDETARHRQVAALHTLRITGLTSLSDTAFSWMGKKSFIGTEVTPLGEVLARILRAAGRPSR